MNRDTNTPEDIKPFTVRFPKPLGRRLAIAAAELETSKQSIVQEAVEGHLNELEIKQQITGGKKPHA